MSPSDPAAETQALVKVFSLAQNGDEIVLGRGVYTIKPAYPAGHATAPLQLLNKTNITVRGGQGVEIFSDGPGELLLISECSGIRFERITFRSNNAPVENGDWLYSIIMLYSRNEKLTFENCQFLNFGNHAISQLYGVKETIDVVIRNCVFADGGDLVVGDGAAVSGIGSRWLLESNRVERCLYGFEIEGAWGTNQNITIRKNTFLQPRGCGVVIFATSGNPAHFSDIEISDNLIKDALRHNGVFPLGIMIGGGERVRVLRNTIENSEGGIVIHAMWADLQNITVADNVITNAGFNGISVNQFQDYKATNIVVRSNIVAAAGQAGIAVTGANIRVQGNTVENSGWQGVYGGIEALGAAERVRIDRNTIGNRDTTFQDYGICIRPGVRDTLIGPNTFHDHVLGAILDEGTNTRVQTRILEATFPRWEVGSTVKIFSPPGSRGQVQTSHNLIHWTSVDEFTADENGDASVLITPEMIMVGYRYYRAVIEE